MGDSFVRVGHHRFNLAHLTRVREENHRCPGGLRVHDLRVYLNEGAVCSEILLVDPVEIAYLEAILSRLEVAC